MGLKSRARYSSVRYSGEGSRKRVAPTDVKKRVRRPYMAGINIALAENEWPNDGLRLQIKLSKPSRFGLIAAEGFSPSNQPFLFASDSEFIRTILTLLMRAIGHFVQHSLRPYLSSADKTSPVRLSRFQASDSWTTRLPLKSVTSNPFEVNDNRGR